MILKTKKVVVGHVFERTVHKFPCDVWFVNYINYTDHFIDKETQPAGVVTPLPPGHDCQDIQVHIHNIILCLLSSSIDIIVDVARDSLSWARKS